MGRVLWVDCLLLWVGLGVGRWCGLHRCWVGGVGVGWVVSWSGVR